MKKYLFPLLAALVGGTLSAGCVCSRIGEHLFAAGTVDYSIGVFTIKEPVVWEENGKYYVQTLAVPRRERPTSWLALIAPPLGCYRDENMRANDICEYPVIAEITPEFMRVLCTAPPKDGESDRSGENSQSFPAFVQNAPADYRPSEKAVKHTILNPPDENAPDWKFGGQNHFGGSGSFRRERAWWSYAMMPLTVAGFALDVPLTVGMSCYFDLIVFPNLLVFKAIEHFSGGCGVPVPSIQ